MENECEALPGVAYPGVRENRSTINTKTGYDDDDDDNSPRLNDSDWQWIRYTVHVADGCYCNTETVRRVSLDCKHCQIL